MPEEMVIQSIGLPSGEVRVWQPQESAELPDPGRRRMGADRTQSGTCRRLVVTRLDRKG